VTLARWCRAEHFVGACGLPVARDVAGGAVGVGLDADGGEPVAAGGGLVIRRDRVDLVRGAVAGRIVGEFERSGEAQPVVAGDAVERVVVEGEVVRAGVVVVSSEIKCGLDLGVTPARPRGSANRSGLS